MHLWANRKKIIISTSLSAYLYRMVYNKLMDFFRKNSKKKDLIISYHKMLLDDVIQVEEQENNERLIKLNQCIEKLPKRCKEVFYDKKIKGIKSKDVAAYFDISLKTVEAHMTKAYMLLKDCLKPSRFL